jgi:hypothetical protein
MTNWVRKTAILSLGLALSPTAWAVTDFRPSWVTHSASSMKHNDSFLSDIQSNLDEARTEAFLKRFFDVKKSAEVRMNFEFLTRDYQMRRHHNLLDPVTERAYLEKFVEQRKEAIRVMSRHQQKQAQQQVKTAQQRGEISTPVVVSSTLAGVYFGEPLNVLLGDDTQLMARTDFISERAEVKLSSTIVDGSVDFASSRAVEEAQRLDPGKQHERYKVSLSRGLGLWDLSSGVSYGGTSNSFTAMISKPLSGNLTCIVDRNQNIANPTQVNDTVQLQYGINF